MDDARRDHLGLLFDVGELVSRLADSDDIPSFLDQIVQMVADRLHSEVCSIYLYDEPAGELVLGATHGLNRAAMGHVRLKLGEGLTGLALEEMRPVCEYPASASPRFRGFEGIDEEAYESFLAVPIRKGPQKIGVLVVQRARPERFSGRDVMALQATASQLASAIESARVFMGVQALRDKPPAAPVPAGEPVKLVRGKAASGGYALAPVVVQDPQRDRRTLTEGSFSRRYTLGEFQDALDQTARQLRELEASVGQRLPEAASMIFDAHLMMLKDPTFVSEITEAIRAGQNPPEAILAVGRRYMDLLGGNAQAYIREKAVDVEDLVKRLLANLTGTGPGVWVDGSARIVVARDLYPSDILKLASGNVAGVVLVSGGVTSHVSILARSLRMPLVIAEDPRLLALPEGSWILLDAQIGNIHVNPAQEVIDTFQSQMADREHIEALKPEVRPMTHTRDGARVHLLANVNLLSDLGLAREVRAEGVGLYRSEFPFLIRSSFPSEQEQYAIYHRLMEDAPGEGVTFRTLDLGGDKLRAYYDVGHEANPALGLRSIRFSLRHRDVFAGQLRAILRAAAEGDVPPLRIMFPMISSLEELRQAKQVVSECIAGLRAEGVDCCRRPAVGIMVEVPAAVEIIDALVQEADFLCIGSNDLIQHLLAVDRTNEKVAAGFTPHHPAVLRSLKRIADAGARAGKEVSICGEMAHEEEYLPFLLGIGLRTLSVAPRYIPALQKRIAEISLVDAVRQAQAALRETTIAGIAGILGLKGAPAKNGDSHRFSPDQAPIRATQGP